MIFDLYDSGMGETLVAKELTRLGRKNGVGKVKWDAGKVSKIIKRKNYLGYTVYCQSYSNNYLEQKRIKRDESEFVYVKGGFPQIISEEQYERCNAIRRSRTKRLTDEKGVHGVWYSAGSECVGQKNEVSLWFSHASTSLENQ